MNQDEEYERLKQEIGWHMTWQDAVFFTVLPLVIWLLVALS